METSNSQINSHVFVNAFARLHMGFLDLNGSLGRRFGSLGLGLDAPDTLIELAVGRDVFGKDEALGYVDKSKELLLAHAKAAHEVRIHDVSIKVHREIPRHFGLGSGTQMALAVGAGLNQLLGLNYSPAEIASITGRGLRSGIGIGTFANGGVVLDAGRGRETETSETKVPPIIAQHAFPEAWRVLLIFDHQHVGVHGDEEVKAFASLDDTSLEAAQKNSHAIVMRALPAIQEHNLPAFGEAIALLQAYTGDYFAPVQGGRYASQMVAEVLKFLIDDGVLCAGQSSWGPTGFAVFESETIAEQYLMRLKSTFVAPQLGWLLCAGSNQGASVNVGNKP